MASMSKALTGLSITISILAVVCVGPVVAQRPSQNTLGNGEKERTSRDSSLEQAMKELKSLNDVVREALQQQAEERVAAARTIATLEAENKQLKSLRDRNELRLQWFEGRERQVKGIIQVKPSWQDTAKMIEKLLKDVTELRETLDRSLPSKPGQIPSAAGKRDMRTIDTESRSKP